MNVFFVLISVVICSIFFAITSDKIKVFFKEKKKEPERLNNETKTMDMGKVTGTKDLFLDTLSKIGCQYELSEEDKDRIFFAYQGENFIADATNEGWYVHVLDLGWEHVELYDVDEFSRLRKAINKSNLNCSTMTVYTIDRESGNVDVHCKAAILFIPQIPEIENYLRGELNDFFQAHLNVRNEMERQRQEELNVRKTV